MVYEPYLLCRSLEVWADKKSISLPADIPLFLRDTYAERDETGLLLDYKNELQKKREKLRWLALLGVAPIGKVLSEEYATTRYSDFGTVDVLLMRSYTFGEDSNVRLRFLDNTIRLFDIEETQNRKEHRAVAADLIYNTVRVPQWFAPQVTLQQMKWLEQYAYISNQKGDILFRAAKVRQGGELCGLGDENPFDGYRASYTAEMGYCVVKTTSKEYAFE